MSFSEAVRSVYRNYAKFDGRAPRSEYWWFQLFFVLAAFVWTFLGGLLSGLSRSSGLFGLVFIGLGVFVLLTLIPSLAVAVRRLHDSDHSGWWFLISLVPYLGGLILLVFMVLPSSAGYNRFGPPYGHATAEQRAQYWGWSRADALRQFAEDAQKAASYGYQPVWQEWRQEGTGEVLEVFYSRPSQLPWGGPWGPPSPPTA